MGAISVVSLLVVCLSVISSLSPFLFIFYTNIIEIFFLLFLISSETTGAILMRFSIYVKNVWVPGKDIG